MDRNTGIVLVEAAPGQVRRCGVTACLCGRMRCGWLVWMWAKYVWMSKLFQRGRDLCFGEIGAVYHFDLHFTLSA